MVWVVIKENCSSSLKVITALFMTFFFSPWEAAEWEVELGHHCPCLTGRSGRAKCWGAAVSQLLPFLIFSGDYKQESSNPQLSTDTGDAKLDDTCLDEDSAPQICCKAKLSIGFLSVINTDPSYDSTFENSLEVTALDDGRILFLRAYLLPWNPRCGIGIKSTDVHLYTMASQGYRQPQGYTNPWSFPNTQQSSNYSQVFFEGDSFKYSLHILNPSLTLICLQWV